MRDQSHGTVQASEPDPGRAWPWPVRPIEQISRPLVQFLHVESASGMVLIVCTAVALIAANSPLGDAYAAFWNQTFHIGVGELQLAYPLWYWVNDALMAIFFFLIGLEIKREMVHGELSDPRQVVLPSAAALGGVLVPIAIYLSFGHDPATVKGWAVPMATDIAFVVGVLALLGPRIPYSLKIMMLTLAIVDDILAVLVIAVFYSDAIAPWWLLASAVAVGVTLLLRSLDVRSLLVYIVVGGILWLCMLESGVHPTVAGVILGLLTPARPWLADATFSDVVERTLQRLRKDDDAASLLPEERRTALEAVSFAVREAQAPLDRIEHDLRPWVAFGIMPIFALANAGVRFDGEAVTDVVAVAVAAGLFLGKPLGVLAASLLTVRLGWARMPEGVSLPMLVGGGCLAGIGFTMALFVASLGLTDGALQAAKAGVLMGSLMSAIVGAAILSLAVRRRGAAAG
jgi:Na+:H+ antiporter, NhaA family